MKYLFTLVCVMFVCCSVAEASRVKKSIGACENVKACSPVSDANVVKTDKIRVKKVQVNSTSEAGIKTTEKVRELRIKKVRAKSDTSVNPTVVTPVPPVMTPVPDACAPAKNKSVRKTKVLQGESVRKVLNAALPPYDKKN